MRRGNGFELASLTASDKDVVKMLLLTLALFLFVSISLFVEHIGDGLMIAMRGLINLHLTVALQLQSL